LLLLCRGLKLCCLPLFGCVPPAGETTPIVPDPQRNKLSPPPPLLGDCVGLISPPRPPPPRLSSNVGVRG